MEDLIDEILVFLREANLYGYGSGIGKSDSPCRNGAKELIYEKGDWYFLDSYFGNNLFVGQEIIYHKGTPIWAMNYQGWPEQRKYPKEVREFLKKALLENLNKIVPVRGPALLIDKDLQYRNRVLGDITHFRGKETIKNNGVLAHTLIYSSGFIR